MHIFGSRPQVFPLGEEDKKEQIKVWLNEEKNKFWTVSMGETDSGYKLKETSMGRDITQIEEHSFYLILPVVQKDKTIRLLRRRLNDFDFPLLELHMAERSLKHQRA